MAKTLNNGRKMKGQVRKTVGALFLASAIVVAAIPTEGLRAATGTGTTNTYEMPGVTQAPDSGTTASTEKVPLVKAGETIYTTYDNRFLFGCITSSEVAQGSDKVAVILYYNNTLPLEGDELTIPDTFDAFLLGAHDLPYAISKVGDKPLYYKETESRQAKDAGGNPLYQKKQEPDGVDPATGETKYKEVDDLTKPIMEDVNLFVQCTGSNYSVWQKFAPQDIYYEDASGSYVDADTNKKYSPTSQAPDMQKMTVPVAYIGRQTVSKNSSGKWEASASAITKASDGVFAGEKGNNIHSLKIESDRFLGIGDYAFNGAGALKELKLQNTNSNFKTIGTAAFEGCVGLESVTLPFYINLSMIPERAFRNCYKLSDFNCTRPVSPGSTQYETVNHQLPYSIRKIGNNAFENCESLASVGLEDQLQIIGSDIFKGCRSLTSLTFPEHFNNSGSPISVEMFDGCVELKYISSSNSTLEFACKYDNFSWFRSLVSDSFYFEGIDNSKLHTLSNAKHIAFKYLDYKEGMVTYDNVYEIVDETAKEDGTVVGSSLYRVQETGVGENDSKLGRLIYYDANPDMELSKNATTAEYEAYAEKSMKDANIPEEIGPVTITEISKGAFKLRYREGTTTDNGIIETVTIPQTVSVIDDDAFKGCYNMSTVYFEDPAAITRIGSDAFRTQQVVDATVLTGTLPQLAFVGEINKDYLPFQYAMEPQNRINQSMDQEISYITYYSGWPDNLVVRYKEFRDPEDDHIVLYAGCTLINYPTFAGFRGIPDDPSTPTIDESEDSGFLKYPYVRKTATEILVSGLDGTSGTEKDSRYNAVQSVWNAYKSKPAAQWSNAETDLINAVLNIELPAGVEFIDGDLMRGGNGQLLVTNGLFQENEKAEIDLVGTSSVLKTLSTGDMKSIRANTFEGCATLKEVNINCVWEGGDSSTPVVIEDYAFKDCANLDTVNISDGLKELGLSPFIGCDKLKGVNFLYDTEKHDPLYSCQDSIIYGMDSEKTGLHQLVEYLNGRGRANINSYELRHVTELAQEAFADTDVGSVDFSEAGIKSVPKKAFQYTKNLYSVTMPDGLRTLGVDSFSDSGISMIQLPTSLTVMTDAFRNTTDGPNGEYTGLTGKVDIMCEKDCNAYDYAMQDPDDNLNWVPVQIYFQVTFVDGENPDNVLLQYDKVMPGEGVTPPYLLPEHEGKKFVRWWCEGGGDYNDVQKNLTVYAMYESVTTDDLKYNVTFLCETVDESGNPTTVTLGTAKVAQGETVAGYDIPTDIPKKPGYDFVGWTPAITEPVTRDDWTFYVKYEPTDNRLTVEFYGYEDGVQKLLKSQRVEPGANATTLAPTVPERKGYTFTGNWMPSVASVTLEMADSDKVVKTYAEYKEGDVKKYTVRFFGMDDKVLFTQEVAEGENAITPQAPEVSGYTFTGWRPAITNITHDVDTYAQYEKGSGTGTGTGTGNGTGTGSGDGTGSGGSGSGGTTPTPAPGTSGGAGLPAKYYTLTVNSGSGSGSYIAGTQPIIIANDPASGMEFSHWTVDPASTQVASTSLSATVVTMPEGNVTITANYKTKSGTSNAGTATSGPTATSRPVNPGSTTGNKGGTTVVIDKNGLSNTGVVSATVNNSSDNFTIKITESASANEAAVNALRAEFGDLTNIKYFPMDISLYDSTGTTKITDTSGLSISITLPIPDSLVPYGGNNKVASAANDRLEKLGAKFTTISGVPCITFTAEHFSPYVIYVDTQNLTAGGYNDDTPKTGDGLHPKWFLSTGLAAVSMVLFLKKDKKKQ